MTTWAFGPGFDVSAPLALVGCVAAPLGLIGCVAVPSGLIGYVAAPLGLFGYVAAPLGLITYVSVPLRLIGVHRPIPLHAICATRDHSGRREAVLLAHTVLRRCA